MLTPTFHPSMESVTERAKTALSLWVEKPLGQFVTMKMQPANQMYNLQFTTVAKLQLWSSNKRSRGHHMGNCVRVAALGRLRTTRYSRRVRDSSVVSLLMGLKSWFPFIAWPQQVDFFYIPSAFLKWQNGHLLTLGSVTTLWDIKHSIWWQSVIQRNYQGFG